MNKKICIPILILTFLVSTIIFASQGEDTSHAYEFVSPKKSHSFDLPNSIRTIEDNAFEGTAITTINLPDTLETIGNYTFANIPNLKNITIPNSISFIGKNAFKGSNQVTVTAAPKSYARNWAKENGIPFIPITSFYAFNTPVQITGLSQTRTEQPKFFLDKGTRENKTLKPTGRMIGELKANKFEEITALHIQGRSPPMCYYCNLYYPT